MKSQWHHAPISPTCEKRLFPDLDNLCGKPTRWGYKAARGGWMALCDKHNISLRDYTESLESIVVRYESRKDVV